MIVIIDGPPASGKSTIATFLKHSRNAKIYCYRRLGFMNIVAKLLTKVAPHLQICDFVDKNFVDPVMIIDSNFLKRISFLMFYLEVMYKFLQYYLFFMYILTKSNVVVDEGPSLGWANYLNLMLNKKALKPPHVDLLMRLDLQFFRALSRLRRLHIWFIDRHQEKLSMLWQRKGGRSPYSILFASLVRYSFKLFREASKRQLINMRVRRLCLP
jgi:hypothetical protein